MLNGVFVHYSCVLKRFIRSIFVRGEGVFVQHSFAVRGYTGSWRGREVGSKEGREVGR